MLSFLDGKQRRYYYSSLHLFFPLNRFTDSPTKLAPLLINPIEMRVLWMEIKGIKSASWLLDREFVNKGGLDLFKEILWVSVGQRGAERPAVKVEGLKKNSAALPASNLSCPRKWRLDKKFSHSAGLKPESPMQPRQPWQILLIYMTSGV